MTDFRELLKNEPAANRRLLIPRRVPAPSASAHGATSMESQVSFLVLKLHEAESDLPAEQSASNEEDTPTRASKKRKNEASRATSQQAGEPSGSVAPQITADRDGPLVTPPAIADERVKAKGKGKKSMRGGDKERTPSPTRSPNPSPAGSSKTKGKRKAYDVDHDDPLLDSPSAKRSKNDTSSRLPATSPTRRRP